MLWLIFALILLAVLVLLLWPLLAVRQADAARIDYDLIVYRDQLAEIERDRARGLLDEVQAGAARLEIQRRMLAAEEIELFISRTAILATEPRRHWRSGLVLAAAIPLGALGLYAWFGHPALPGQPFASRQNDPAFETQGMIAHIETEMRQAPSADGYRMLGELYSQQERYDEAARAYRKALSLGTPDGQIYALLAEAEVMNSGGSVVPEARADFLAALRLDPTDPRARFYLGLAESEIGEYAKAIAIWRDLERDSPADAPWLGMLREHITVFAKQGGLDAASIAPAAPVIPAGDHPAMPSARSAVPVGPLADAVAGAAPQERQAMIRSMVDGLAAKLESDPANLDGWLRLARAYKVLGEPGKAEDARSRAAALIAALPAGAARDEAQARLATVMN